jgi:phosphinothricin acetyltransferase
MPITVVDSTSAHLAAFSDIHEAAARESASTFDVEAHPIGWWEELLAAGDPEAGDFLLAALDGDRAVGYAKSGPHRAKASYATTRETTVYVAASHRGAGVGHALYGELLGRLDRLPLAMAVAGVTQPNPASDALHLAHGFELIGTFANVGVKFGRPWDVRWYQRELAGLTRWPAATARPGCPRDR